MLFISYNNKNASIYDHKTGEIKNIPIHVLKNLKYKSIVLCDLKKFYNTINKNFILNNSFDILELLAFVKPNIFCTNSILGISKALKLKIPKTLNDEAISINFITNYLLEELNKLNNDDKSILKTIANFMQQDNWSWSDFIVNKLYKDISISNIYLKVGDGLSELQKIQNINNEFVDIKPVHPKDIESKLKNFTINYKTLRPNQLEYAIEISKIFNANKEDNINISFAEAGTGIGKTIAYLSSVISFIEKNPTKTIVISTYSKTLQRQILKELEEQISEENLINKITLIKGANNYICLLKFEYFLNSINNYKYGKIFAGFIYRWLQITKNGDIEGGDLVPWLFNLFNYNFKENIIFKHDECIYSKCTHYKKCFITKIKNKVKQSNIIISNHTLTLINNFKSDYIIFDEAHHLNNISDEVFSSEISGNSGLYLRNWIIGNNSKLKQNTSLNGLRARLQTLLQNENTSSTDKDLNDEINFKLQKLINTFIYSSKFLPEANYIDRIATSSPIGNFENFLHDIYNHVLSYNNDLDKYYSLESSPINLENKALNNILKLKQSFMNMLKIALSIKLEFGSKLSISSDENKKYIEEFIISFEITCINKLLDFISMLEEISKPDARFIYRFVINKEENIINNIGYIRNHINPMLPFAHNIVKNKKGVAFTSATLIDPTIKNNSNIILSKFGLDDIKTINLVSNIIIKSPFNYKEQSKIIILNTEYSKNITSLSHAIAEIFIAAKGGSLAIFTAITRLKMSHKLIKNRLEEHNINLFGQYSNNKNFSTSSVVDLFKEDINSCLLGTDGLRDGIDIPGQSLRLVVFEKIPWPKKDILNTKRQQVLGKELYKENIRFKLRQAFGRIIRKETDKGIFVMLSPSLPSEFLNSFPEKIEVLKINLQETLMVINNFLENNNEKK